MSLIRYSASAHDIPRFVPTKDSSDIYGSFPSLRPFQEFLGPIDWSDICGSGQCAIIVRSGESFVGKYGLTDEEQEKLEKEFSFHNRILEIYNYGRSIGEIPDTIVIPRLRFKYGFREKQPYVMEYIKGKSLFTLRMARKHIPEIDISSLAGLTDHEVRDMIKERKGVDIGIPKLDTFNTTGILTARSLCSPELVSDLERTIAFLSRYGIRHRDLHDGNIMKMDDGRLCILDFGKVRYSPTRLDQFDAILDSISPLTQ